MCVCVNDAGDGHAAQGDGEVCGSAIETDMFVRARLSVIKAGAGPSIDQLQYVTWVCCPVCCVLCALCCVLRYRSDDEGSEVHLTLAGTSHPARR
jgi:hypothetical protein